MSSADQRAVAESDHRLGVDSIEDLAGLFRRQHGSLAFLHHMLWPAHGAGRIHGKNLTENQPLTESGRGPAMPNNLESDRFWLVIAYRKASATLSSAEPSHPPVPTF